MIAVSPVTIYLWAGGQKQTPSARQCPCSAELRFFCHFVRHGPTPLSLSHIPTHTHMNMPTPIHTHTYMVFLKASLDRQLPDAEIRRPD
ncbi:unnamed protein product [Protopolystoma xenopodis]|uniref:Uncharacterized protein n=1 Tax=Protopolystoma xenopodis TaxID=117903 RepID=A0A3S5BWA4_9PLAT|nr:unnamed protein product [Protopolystoma xenopodis]